ncbi:hypothetical protein EGW08_003830 [Elysia chlorotica]|uniref:Vitamin K-dependent gamma-carboxylase n=1 Tax=Elysia chlorotica TaxID=188477 RepID=A0A433U3Q0_ELYCH|nr:hypothetical protein EGW08_003830 [Elysia chlorotica]
MIIDTLEERGMANADYRWGDPTQCRFPLINWWKPLPLQWMYIVYTVQLTSAVCLMLGLAYRVSCPTFMCCYWYILLLEKSDWNNHSYLFGLCAFLFTISDGNRYWSIDALINPKIRNAHVPSWNYVLFRAQLFLVYFIAGLKKLDQDWVMGYSMQHLSEHAAFDPFRLFLTSSQIDHFVVHLGGLMIDLSVGFLLLHEESRPWGLAISTLFNTLNSLIFSIGMFPYGMMCMQLIFCSQNLPREILASLRLITRDYREGDCQPSHHCVYTKKQATSLASRCSSPCKEQVLPTQPNRRHRLVSAFTLAFIAWQCFLPYSHGITKGYNNWTNGMYGYSWDMMVHNWHVQHIRITYKDKDTNETGYIDPRVWTSGSTRWSGHVDMVKQYAHCIERNLKDYNITNIEIYFDIWRSLNQRFQQRLVDPTVDVLQAEWHPFQQTTWMMPLIVNKTSWRERMNELDKVMNEDRTDENYTSTVFVADFPGMNLESYVDKDFGNTSLHVLEGEVIVEILDEGKNYLLKAEESMQIPADGYHNVHTVSSTPSSYMYTFINTTDVEFMEKLNRIEDEAKTSNKTVNETLAEHNDSYILNLWNEAELQEAKLETEDSVIYGLKNALWKKFSALRRSLHLGPGAVYCLITNSSFSDFLNSWYPRDLD